MKYFLTLSLMATVVFSAHSQLWFDAGVKGAFGPTLMYDDNVFDSGTYKHKLTTGTSIGGRLGVNFGYHAGVSLEYNSATSKQDFEFQSDPYDTYKWKHNDIVAAFRYSGNGAYVEIGGKYSKLKSVEQDNVERGIEDVSEFFEKNYTSGILGFGSYLAGSELLTLNLGIRLHWALTDMVNEAGKDANFPIRINSLPDPSRKTLATAAQLQVELNYAFGRFAKTACSDRWRLILFQ